MEGPFIVLPDAEPANRQDQISSGLSAGFDGIDHPQRVLVTYADPEEWVREQVALACGRSLGSTAIWVRLYRKDESRGLLAVLQPPSPDGEGDLILAAHRGMLTKSVLRLLCGWAFGAASLRRVVTRIPVNRPDIQHAARRGGFRHEGTARGFYVVGSDASLWAMHHANCPWLLRPMLAIPTVDVSPTSSAQVH